MTPRKFNPLSLCPGAGYEVQGSEAKVSADIPTLSSPHTPFGAYPCTHFAQQNPLPHSPRSKQRSIKKTILFANILLLDSNKASSSKHRFVHTIVTGLICAGHSVETSASADVDRSSESSNDFEDFPSFGALDIPHLFGVCTLITTSD